jgi:hypothetical protein
VTLRVVYAAPGKPAEIREIDGSLESMHALVGGYLEVVGRVRAGRQTVEEFDIIGDEEARLKWDFSEPDVTKQAVQPNRWLCGQDVLGPVFVTKADGDGEWIGLSLAEAEWFIEMLNACQPVKPSEIREPGFTITSLEDR